MRDRLDGIEPDQLPGQQARRPARAALGRGGAGERDQVRLLRPVERPLVDPVGPLARQRRRQPLGREPPPGAQDGARGDVQRPGDGGVRPPRAAFAGVGLEQDAGAGQQPRRGGARADQGPEVGALLLARRDAARSPSPRRTPATGISRVTRH